MKEAPFFIVGNRRSGTTLLRLMLAAHPRLGVPPESGFTIILGWYFGAVWFDRRTLDCFLDRLLTEDFRQDWALSREDLERPLQSRLPCNYPTIIDAVYRVYLEKNFPGAYRWGDKTTWYQHYLEDLDAYFPNAQYIHIIRDPRAVLASYRKVPHLPDDALEVAADWRRSVSAIRSFGARNRTRYLEVAYEDLVVEPERELRRICSFLNETFDSMMLDYHRLNRERGLEPARHMGWKRRTLDPPAKDRIDAWRHELEPADVEVVNSVAGPLWGKDAAGSSECPGIWLYRAASDLKWFLRLRGWRMKHRLRAVVRRCGGFDYATR